MILRRFSTSARQALLATRENWGVSALTIATIATTLFLGVLYLLIIQNLERLASQVGRPATVVAYLKDSATPERATEIAQEIQKLTPEAEVEVVGPQESLERIRKRGPEEAALVDGLDPSLLPVSIDISPQSGMFVALSEVEDLAGSLQAYDEVTEVDFGQRELAQVERLFAILHAAGIALGFVVVLAASFIVANTIRLTVYARRDEIEILRLVGATRWFVRTPFLIEGALWGFLGGLVTIIGLMFADALFSPAIVGILADWVGRVELIWMNIPTAILTLTSGTLLGLLGSTLAVARFLHQDPIA